MKSQKEALNPVKLFSQARHAFRIPQRLTLSGMTRRGVASPEIVTFILCALFMGASSISQMPGLVGLFLRCLFRTTVSRIRLDASVDFGRLFILHDNARSFICCHR